MLKIKRTILISITLFAISALLIPQLASAIEFSDDERFTVPNADPKAIDAKTTGDLVIPIIGWVLAAVGIICVAVIVYAGVKIATSGDREEERRKGVKFLTWAIIGMIIVLAAFAIVAILAGGLEAVFNRT